jgi:tetratricopeptide (TPR) repeat protein
VARSPHAIPATFISVKRWPGMSRRSCRGATHPNLARSAQPNRSPTAVRVSHQAPFRASLSAPIQCPYFWHRSPWVPCVTAVRAITFAIMTVPRSQGSHDLASQLQQIAREYHATANIAAFRKRLTECIANATPDALIAAAEPHRDEPEIVAPIYEAIVAAQPDNARALVILANAYWLQGRGPEPVGELATRAIAADPANRGAWHLWALTESDPRGRVRRWQQVSERFPGDDLALAATADNAASVAGAEHDYQMLDFAIETYERLLERTTEQAQREAVITAIKALRGWKF